MIALLLALAVTWAAPTAKVYKNSACGVLVKFEGEVYLISNLPKELLQTRMQAAIPCDGWVSIRTGWAEIQTKSGHVLRLGVDTFVKLSDELESVSLFRGRVHVSTRAGSGGISLSTANAIARVPSGKAMLYYDASEEKTQLIAIEHASTLENKFEGSRKIVVKPGEATVLDFRAARLLPSTPNAVEIAEAKKLVLDLNLESEDREEVLAVFGQRLERRIPSELKIGKGAERKLASIKRKHSYARHRRGSDDAEAKAQWMRHFTGGEQDVRDIMESKSEYRGPAGHAAVTIEDADGWINPKRKKIYDAEKKRLLEELSKIQLR